MRESGLRPVRFAVIEKAQQIFSHKTRDRRRITPIIGGDQLACQRRGSGIGIMPVRDAFQPRLWRLDVSSMMQRHAQQDR